MVYCEAGRFRFEGFDRNSLIDPLKKLADAYLKRSVPLRFMSSSHLPKAILSAFELLLVPEMSGMAEEEMQRLAEFARGGGKVLLTGRATSLRREMAKTLPDFAMGEALGLHFERQITPSVARKLAAKCGGARMPKATAAYAIQTLPSWNRSQELPDSIRAPAFRIDPLDRRRDAGECQYETSNIHWCIFATWGPARSAILHAAIAGTRRGRDGPDVRRMPIQVSPAGKQAILTRQGGEAVDAAPDCDGDYTVEIHKTYAAPTKIVERYPAEGWSFRTMPTESGLRIQVFGQSPNRLLVLE